MLIPLSDLIRRHKIVPKGVVHLGANTGQEAADYEAHGFHPVYWIEALPDLFFKLKEHLKHFPNQFPLLACLGDVNGKRVKFNIASNQGQSSSYLEFGTHAKEHPTVKYIGSVEMRTIRFETIADEFRIPIQDGWFLNVDLQGAELMALKGMGNYLKHFHHLYIEVNERELYKGCPLVDELDAWLYERGFEGVEVKMTGNGWGDKYYRRIQMGKIPYKKSV